jgi:hypothetical protein
LENWFKDRPNVRATLTFAAIRLHKHLFEFVSQWGEYDPDCLNAREARQIWWECYDRAPFRLPTEDWLTSILCRIQGLKSPLSPEKTSLDSPESITLVQNVMGEHNMSQLVMDMIGKFFGVVSQLPQMKEIAQGDDQLEQKLNQIMWDQAATDIRKELLTEDIAFAPDKADSKHESFDMPVELGFFLIVTLPTVIWSQELPQERLRLARESGQQALSSRNEHIKAFKKALTGLYNQDPSILGHPDIEQIRFDAARQENTELLKAIQISTLPKPPKPDIRTFKGFLLNVLAAIWTMPEFGESKPIEDIASDISYLWYLYDSVFEPEKALNIPSGRGLDRDLAGNVSEHSIEKNKAMRFFLVAMRKELSKLFQAWKAWCTPHP